MSAALTGQDRRPLPLAGFRVRSAFLGATRVELAAYGDDDAMVKLGLAGTFELQHGDGVPATLDAGVWSQLRPLLELQDERIDSATYSLDGELTVSFEGGVTLDVRPADGHESWELFGPGSVWLVAPAGGGDPRIDV